MFLNSLIKQSPATFPVKSVLSSLMLVLLLSACKPATENTDEAEKQPNDPNVVELSKLLQDQVKLATVGKADIREILRVPGSIQVDEQRVARIGASVTGRITDIDVILGQDVKQGQVLATLNSTELAQNQLLYIKAWQQIALQTKAVERARQLLEADVIGAAELQRREAELSAAQADLYTAKEQLHVLGMSDQAIAQIAHSGQMRSYSSVYARLAGTIISRKVNLGQVVQPAEELFIVADLSRVWAVAEVPEQQAELVQEGEDVDIEIPALSNRKFTGKLIFVGDVVNPLTRTVTVRTDMVNTDHTIKPDMLVSMLVQSKAISQMAVPRRAVVRENDKNHVFVEIAPNKFRMREVELGTEYQELVAVTAGLDEGEKIVAEGAFHVNNERKRKELE
ncbi:efflux RND transporter periplasmic adaptor subunit [Methylobacillus gramineus]|uniref:efflux RND transporter periplasmic adaptor subunit n=1 Tax=Methylobacillus gramineus TaxID=755169 RepID=UPI001CFFCE8B|nr:efflux RND transporter periplasmic adaptor subunit [Methylobacillus gramineus]MCB5185173.1 efflux RND transporter periplasmic adaptor subunit [Methylobacillus gramineus]